MTGQIVRALMRKPGPNISTALSMDKLAKKIDFAKALAEHQDYANLLRSLAITVDVLDADLDFPDGLFVEDTYLVADRKIIELNPGAPSRSQEYTTLKPFLPKAVDYCRVPKHIFIDGGDILVDNDIIFVGLSQRTQAEAIPILQGFLPKHKIIAIPVSQGLHLKSAMTRFGHRNYVVQSHLLAQLQHITASYSLDITTLTVPDAEAHAANLLYLNDHIIMPNDCPLTLKKLQNHFLSSRIHLLDTTQVRLIDGAISCCSLLFDW